MDRVVSMLNETPQQRRNRNPLQKGALYLLPHLRPHILDINKYPPIVRARDAFAVRHADIRREITQHLEKHGRAPVHDDGIDAWRAVFLSVLGREQESTASHFPATMDYIRSCSDIIYPLAGISFSVLEPGAFIPPHSDRTNVFIHFHQGVAVPADCALKVAGEVVDFEEAGSFLFDPSYEHSAWNRSPSIRIQLILPVWHPDITGAEREALVEVFNALIREMGG
jgi:aspartyl/asparaginyl beta-hydroxylase (cupin superfamily)